MPASRHSPEQRQEALNIYREHGVAVAHRQTGIARTTISTWARRTGVRTDAPSLTRAAVEQASLNAAEKRERMRVDLLDLALHAAERMRTPHEEFVGVEGKRVVYELPPAGAFKQYSQSIKDLIGVLRLESGEATGRTESVAVDKIDVEIKQLVAEMAAREGAVEPASP